LACAVWWRTSISTHRSIRGGRNAEFRLSRDLAIDKLNGEINAGLVDPGLKARLAGLGGAENAEFLHRLESGAPGYSWAPSAAQANCPRLLVFSSITLASRR
jgi:hypothetical protein